MTDRPFQPSGHILSGQTADVYFLRTREVLEREGLNPVAVMEVFPSRDGILCGMREVEAILREALPASGEAWAVGEGQPMSEREVVLRIKAPYLAFCLYETAILGILASESAWAAAAAECVQAAAGIPVISFGARHVHPVVAPYMDYAAIVGGCQTGSTPLGSALGGREPSGTMPHAMVLCFGDTVRAALAFDQQVDPDVPRVVLVDTFRDEPEEAVRVAEALGERLQAVRLDTPGERGGVTPALVKETRARLDLAGHGSVKIFVSGGITPERIRWFGDSGAAVDGFGVGSYISSAKPNDFTADLKEIEGKPVGKRGRIPGITPNPRLERLI